MSCSNLLAKVKKSNCLDSAFSLMYILLVTVALISFAGKGDNVFDSIPKGFGLFSATLFLAGMVYILLVNRLGEERTGVIRTVLRNIFDTKMVGILAVLVISKLTEIMFFPYAEVDTGMPVYFLSYFALGIYLMLSVIPYVSGCNKFLKACAQSTFVCSVGFFVGRVTKSLNVVYETVYYITIIANACIFFYTAYDLTAKRSLIICRTFIGGYWKNVTACLMAAGCGIIFEAVRATDVGEGLFWMRAFFTSAICFCITECVFLYKKKENFVERAVLCVLLTLGISMAVLLPFSTLVTWDDESHYHSIIQLAQGMNWTSADWSMSTLEILRYTEPQSISQRAAYFAELNNRGNILAFEPFFSEIGDINQVVGYFPHCFGIWIGQVLNLPFGYVFYFGRITSVVFYALVIYAAMKHLKSGKLLLAVIALLPTNLFQASNYTYDSWIVCLAAYAVAIFIGYLQKRDKLLGIKEALVVTSIMMLAVAPKGVYFPLLAIFFFVPTSKFENRSQQKNYLTTVIGMTILCFLLYMLLPFLGGNHTGDTRYGSEISASGQIAYILTNPISYMKTFWGFFEGYASLSGSYGWTSFMAYLGGKDFHMVLCALLIFAALIDRCEKDRIYNTFWCKIGGLLAPFASAVVVVTIMYCACTPVGADFIDGCQPRYLAPLIFPVLIMCLNFGYFVPKNRERFSAMTLVLSGYIASASIWSNIISYYIP